MTQRKRIATLFLVLPAALHGCSDSGTSGPGPSPDGTDDVAEPEDTVGGETSEPEDAQEPDTGPKCETTADCLGVLGDVGPCKIAVCDQTQGVCVTGNKKTFTPCDDGDGCTEGEVCDADGACAFGQPKGCDDGNECTDDSCGGDGSCVFTPNTVACDDGNGCTENDACAGGSCAGTPPAAGCGCTTTEDCATFEDGNDCNGVLTCSEGQCTVDASSIVVCDATGDTSCLKNTCDPATGACAPKPAADGKTCSDSNPCTVGDACQGGVCSGADAGCACEADADCAEFDDADKCNGKLTCQSGTCKTDADSVVTCTTSTDPCSKSVCEPATGECKFVGAVEGSSCNDGDVCTQKDTCSGGACAGIPLVCEDGDTCTADSCNPQSGCQHKQKDCNDSNPCTTDGCDSATGACTNEAVSCDDGDPCTDDECDTTSGACASIATDCNDFDACTADSCGADGCVNEGITCDDGDLCTDDLCDPDIGCSAVGIPGCDACCQPSATPGCGDGDLEACVCAIDAACCEIAWDELCVETAKASCEKECVEKPSDDACCSPSDLPGCENPVVEECVCALDEFCCDSAWDLFCVEASKTECGNVCEDVVGPGEGEDCCLPSGGLGCSDPDCTDCVCALDPFCCDTAWDDLCAGEAVNDCGPDVCDCADPGVCGDGKCSFVEDCATCPGDCGECPPPGDCCSPGTAPGCNDAACQDLVCALDPFCCDTAWDGICADEASQLCEVCGGTPPVCENGSCDIGENCSNCPVDCGECGSCCEANPAGLPFCNDDACVETVCAIDAFCCDTAWDQICADEAAQLCEVCGGTPPVCGDAECSITENCLTCAEDCGECSCCEPSPAGTPGCSEASCQDCVCALDPFCCDTAWDGICADEALNQCGAEVCSCADPGVCGDETCSFAEDCVTCPGDCGECGGCCEPNPTGDPFCNDPACTEFICSLDPFCCDTSWDQLCADAANQYCEACGGAPPVCGDGTCDVTENCSTCLDDCGECGSCCEANPEGVPFCNDEACVQTVCAIDPFCCDTAWDQICADEAAQLCEACGGTPPVCGDEICAPSENCLTCAEDCGECSCCEPSPTGTPGCSEASCQDCVCALDPFCCDTAWDGICADEALNQCGADVCSCADPGVCGDETCSFAENCSTCPVDCGECGGCCEPNPLGQPGCNDEACQATICAADPFCCDTAWDDLCANAAGDLCEVCGGAPPECGDLSCDPGEDCASCPDDCGACPEPGDCCTAGQAPGCNDPICQDCVCALDAFCCDTAWDDLCAGEALNDCGIEFCACADPGVCGDESCSFAEDCETCPLDCGDCPEKGDCCVPGEAPGCNDATCEADVCAIDGFCCDTAWDEICAGEAADLCEVCGGTPPVCGDLSCNGSEDCATCPGDCGECPEPGDCCAAGQAPGCNDATCQDCVCALDAFCCDTAWDGICASEALNECADSCACADPGVCGDESCSFAEDCETCPLDCGDCPEPGDCCVPGEAPGCNDATCEADVCAIDGFCCDTAWDEICAGEAADLCEVCGGTAPVCGDLSCSGSEDCETCPDDCGACPEPGDCCVPGEAPGCTDATCQDQVCAIDDFCCTDAWDEICAGEAADLCEICGGSPPPTNDCCVPAETPGCADAACSDCVCALDAFCCEFAWDPTCTGEAAVDCGSECGCEDTCGNDACGETEHCANCPDDCGACDDTDCCTQTDALGCGDAVCATCVCDADPFCCNVAWDDQCALATGDACAEACSCEPAPVPPGYAEDVQPILGVKCATCHTGGGSGGHNLGTTYADAFKSTSIAKCKDLGLNKAECALVRIQAGDMPLGKGCGGPVADDATNANKCITVSEFAVLQAWVDGGINP